MDHHEAVRTPSTSSAHSEADPSQPMKFKLVSPLGGEALHLDWNVEHPPVDTVNVWIGIIAQIQAKLKAIKTSFEKNKDERGRERPVSLHLPDPKKSQDPSDLTDSDITGTPKERYYKKFCLIMQIYTVAASQLSKLWKGASNPDAKEWYQDRCDTPLLTLICNTTFNSAVSSVKLLNSHYTPFSSEVYGETKYEQMQLIIEQLKFKENDVFVDLGSGVGHLVLYVAGATKIKKAVGIEKAEVPAGYAEKMGVEYKKWMGWFKKKHRPFELHSGDFLAPEFKSIIQEATIIFINNYAFNPDLENRIKMEIINELETGRRIVSTKPYAPVSNGRTFNPRSVNQMEAILDVTVLETVDTPTSWTDKTVPYYLHTVNQAKLQEYYDSKSKSQSSSLSSVSNSRRASVSSKSNSSNSSREGSQANDIMGSPVPTVPSAVPKATVTLKEDEDIYGPTTRKKWKEYTGELDSRKAKRKSPQGSPAWNEPDTLYTPPGSKKIKKESKATPQVKKEKKESKPKSSKAPSRSLHLSQGAKATLTSLHNMTEELMARPIETEGPGLERVVLSASSPSIADEKNTYQPPPGYTILNPTDPLDSLLIEWRFVLRDYLRNMSTELYRQELLREIAQESNRKQELVNQVDVKTSQVQMELAKGLVLVQEKFVELGMPNVETPPELLANSKRIVADHKELTQNVSQIEAEVALLSGKTRNAVPYGAALLENIHLLEDPSQWDPEKGSIHSQFIARIAVENGHAPPKEEPPEIMTETVMSPTGPRPKRNKTRSGPGRKTKQEENSEELDRQVKEFVQVALSVDQQAKEKERRARAAAGPPAEKTSKKSNTPSATVESLGVTLPRTIPNTTVTFDMPSRFEQHSYHDGSTTTTN